MSYKSMITHVVADSSSASRLRMAESAAKVLGCQLVGAGAQAPWPGPVGAGENYLEMMRAAESELALARQAFCRHFETSSIETAWRSEVGYPDEIVPRLSAIADLVLAYPTRGDIDRLAYTSADVLAMEAGLPVLVMPRSERDFRADTILVCWKNTREARRAISASLPLLAGARRVLLAAVCGRDELDTVERELAEVSARLARHGATAATLAEVDSGAGAGHRLLHIAGIDNSDLIVSGAYGHSRLREWVLGGVTQDLLRHGEPYILLVH